MSALRLLSVAAIAAAASLLPASTASAGCYSGCGYAAPVVHYASPCSPCGYHRHHHHYHHRHYHPAPMYVVNQGPSYTAPVIGEPEGVIEYGFRRLFPFFGHARKHYHHGMRHPHHGWRHRVIGPRVHYGPR